MYVIYALIDPRDQHIHYVGMTDKVYDRFIQHIQCSGGNYEKNAWMHALRQANVLVRMDVLETTEDKAYARMREGYWIRHYQSLGEPLKNILTPSPASIDAVSPSQRSTIVRMYQQGFPLRAIAKFVGLSGQRYRIFKLICQQEGIVLQTKKEV